MKMLIMVGLPGSGKSSWVKQNRPDNTIVVSRDNIRLAQYGVYWSKDVDENFITKIERQQIIAALENGYDVISDNTNLTKSYVQRLVHLASQFGATVEFRYFDAAPPTCIEYDKNRDKKVGEKVINRMAKRAGINDKGHIPRHDYYWHEIKPYVADDSLPPAIIVDIDGTIAVKSDRSPYDYSRVYEDTVSQNVMDIVDAWAETEEDGHVIFLSGRNEECRKQTTDWLLDKTGYDVEESDLVHLFMRPQDDPNTADFIVKDRLFDEHIDGKYNVVAAFDDRRQVVQLWHTKQLTVLDVARNKF